jgi:hypothetical protein
LALDLATSSLQRDLELNPTRGACRAGTIHEYQVVAKETNRAACTVTPTMLVFYPVQRKFPKLLRQQGPGLEYRFFLPMSSRIFERRVKANARRAPSFS